MPSAREGSADGPNPTRPRRRFRRLLVGFRGCAGFQARNALVLGSPNSGHASAGQKRNKQHEP